MRILVRLVAGTLSIDGDYDVDNFKFLPVPQVKDEVTSNRLVEVTTDPQTSDKSSPTTPVPDASNPRLLFASQSFASNLDVVSPHSHTARHQYCIHTHSHKVLAHIDAHSSHVCAFPIRSAWPTYPSG